MSAADTPDTADTPRRPRLPAMACAALLAMASVPSMPSPGHAFEWEGDSAGASLLTHARTYTLLIYDLGADDRRRSLIDLGVADPTGLPATELEQAAVVERFRVVLDAWAGEAWSLSAHYDLLPIFGTFATAGFFTSAENPLRLWDFDRLLHEDDDWTLQHGLDRLVLRYLHPRFEVRVGRQAIGFGGARLFNAADLFAALGPASIDSEFKGGVDAVHVIVPLDEFHEVGLVAVGNGDDLAEGLYLARWRGMFDGFDVGAMAGSTYGRATVALEVAGDIGGAGWYVETSARLDHEAPEDTPIRATVGLDHHFSQGIRLLGEVHYNGAGGHEPDDYLALQSTRPYTVGEVYLLGTYYAGALMTYELHPLVNVGLSWLQNLTDGSALAGPTLAWDFAQEVSLGAGALVPIGERLAIGPSGRPRVESEFGLYPLVVFTDLRLAL